MLRTLSVAAGIVLALANSAEARILNSVIARIGAYPGAGSTAVPGENSLRLNGSLPIVAFHDPGTNSVKVATCTANCSTTPIWQVVTVDTFTVAPINVQDSQPSMQLNAGNPVISYTGWVDGVARLKLATCLAACAGPTPTWQIVTVDTVNNPEPSPGTGFRSSLQLLDGKPVISYNDRRNNVVKLATCIANCATAAPTWQISAIGPGGTYSFTSLALNGENPVVAYDASNGFKLATCLLNCATSSPNWQIVSPAAPNGEYPSLQLRSGNPVLAYKQGSFVKVATCTAGCQSAAPTWQYSTVAGGAQLNDDAGTAVLTIDGDQMAVSYSTGNPSRLNLAICTADCSTAPVWQVGPLYTIGSFYRHHALQRSGNDWVLSYFNLAHGDVLYSIVSLPFSYAAIDFGYASTGITAPGIPVKVVNTGTGSLNVTSVMSSDPQFSASHDCVAVAPAGSCTVTVVLKPAMTGAFGTTVGVGGLLSILTDSPMGSLSVDMTGVAEYALVSHYYQSILGRVADGPGRAFWNAEGARVASLGANVNETWFAMAAAFYASGEYANRSRTPTQFVTDLYETFYDRAPDSGGLSYWTGQLSSGMPREVVLAEFMFSPEFAAFTQSIFGNTAVRAEIDMVMDFYRGLLARLPDNGGFAHWRNRFRAAQCQEQAAVLAEVESVSSLFALSAEYVARNRSNSQYVGDLYNAFLRRGGDLTGVQHWIGQLDSGTMTREQVRVMFKESAEFQSRVNAVVQQGCVT